MNRIRGNINGINVARGALVRPSVSTLVNDSTNTQISYGTVIYDTDGIWNASNPTRLTVPSWASFVRIHAGISWQVNTTGDRTFFIEQNGASPYGMPYSTRPTTTDIMINSRDAISSPPIQVVGGDYFEVTAWQNSGSNLTSLTLTGNYFSMEIIG